MLKKLLFAELMFCFLSMSLFCEDFKKKENSNYITVDFECDKKIISGSEVFFGSNNVKMNCSAFSSFFYKKESIEGPYIDEDKYYFSVKFKNWFTGSSHTLKITGKYFIDKNLPKVKILMDDKAYFRKSFYKNSPFDFKILIPKDCSINNKKGVGYKKIEYSISGEVFSLDNLSLSDIEIPLSISNEGKYNLCVKLEDKFSNKSETNFDFYLDKTPPVFTKIENPSESKFINHDFYIAVSATDNLSGINNSSWSYKLESEELYSPKNEENYKVLIKDDGIYNYTFRVEDLSSNSTLSKSITVKKDSVPPLISFSENSEQWINKKNVRIITDDVLSGVNEKSIKFKEVNSDFIYSTEMLFSFSGMHEISVFAEDNAENQSTLENIKFYIDLDKPILEKLPSKINSNLISINAQDLHSGIKNIFWKKSIDKNWINSDLIELEDGKYSIDILVQDNAGNEILESFDIIIDTSKPKISFITNRFFNSDKILIKDFSVSNLNGENIELSFFLNDILLEKFSELPKENFYLQVKNLQEGDYNLKCILNFEGEEIFTERFISYDVTNPEIDNIILKSNEMILNDEDYIQLCDENYLEVNFIFSDNNSNQNFKFLYYDLTSSEWKEFNSSNFFIKDFVSGINQLNFKLVDEANNESNIFARTIIYYEDKSPTFTPILEKVFFDEQNNAKYYFNLESEENFCLYPKDFSVNLFDENNKEVIFEKEIFRDKGKIYLIIKNIKIDSDVYKLVFSSLGLNGIESEKKEVFFNKKNLDESNLDFNIFYDGKIYLQWNSNIIQNNFFKVFIGTQLEEDDLINWNAVQIPSLGLFTVNNNDFRYFYLKIINENCYEQVLKKENPFFFKEINQNENFDFYKNFSLNKNLKIDFTNNNISEDCKIFIKAFDLDSNNKFSFKEIFINDMNSVFESDLFSVEKNYYFELIYYKNNNVIYSEDFFYYDNKFSKEIKNDYSIYNYLISNPMINSSLSIEKKLDNQDFTILDLNILSQNNNLCFSQINNVKFYDKKLFFSSPDLIFKSNDNLFFINSLEYDNSNTIFFYDVKFSFLNNDFFSDYFVISNNGQNFISSDLFYSKDLNSNFSFYIEDNLIRINSNFDFYTEIYNLYNLSYERKVNLHSVYFKLNEEFQFGKLYSDENIIITENNKFYVSSGYFIKDVLVIEKLYTDFFINNNKFTLIIQDIEVFSSGEINTQFMKYYVCDESGSIIDSFYYDDILIDFSDLILSKDFLVSVKGKFNNSINDDLLIQNINLKNGKIEFSNSSLEPFNFTLHDHVIYVNKSYIDFRTNFLFVSEAYVFFDDERIQISNLILDSKNINSIISPGDLTSFYKDFKSYGEKLFFYNGKLNDSGFYFSISIPVYKSVDCILIDDFKFSTFESFFVKSIYNRFIDYCGFNLFVKEFEFDSSILKFNSGYLDIKEFNFFDNNGTIELLNFESFELNYFGIIEKNIFSINKLNCIQNSFNYFLNDICISQNGLEFNLIASSEINDRFIYLDLISVNLNSSGIFFGGYLESKNNFYVISDYIINLNNVSFIIEENESIIFSKESMIYFSDDSFLEIGNIKIKQDLSFEFFDIQNFATTSFKSLNKISLSVDNVSFNNNKFFLSGFMSLKEISSSEAYVNNIELNNSGFLLTSSNNIEIEYYYNSYKISGKIRDINEDCIFLEENIFFIQDKKINLGSFYLNSFFLLDREIELEQNIILENQFAGSRIVSSKFGNFGLSVSINYKVFDFYSDCFIFLRDIHINPNGEFSLNYNLDEFAFNSEFLSFEFSNLNISSDLISSEEVILHFSLPSENLIIKLNEISFNRNGCFLIESSSVSAFSFLGFVFCVDNFTLNQDYIMFSGKAILPEELPGVLSELCLNAKDVKISMQGEFLSGDICIEGEYDISLYEKLGLQFKNISFLYENKISYLKIENSSLIFPENDFLTCLELQGLMFNLNSMCFDFERVSLKSKIELNVFGIDFILNELIFNRDYSFGFDCSLSFSNEKFPEFLRNSFMENAFVLFSSKGEILDLNINLTNLSGKISEDISIFELSEGNISIIKSDFNSIILDINGNLIFTKEAPSDLMNSKLSIEDFKINLSDMEILSLRASGSDFNFNILNLQFTNISAYVDYSKDLSKTFSFSGSLILPDFLPSGLSSSVIEINSFIMDFQGNILDLSLKGFTTEIFEISSGIELHSLIINVNYIENDFVFNLESLIKLNDSFFLEDVRGSTSNLNLVFNTKEITYLNSNFVFSNIKLFDLFYSEKIIFNFILSENNTMIFDISGNLILSKNVCDDLSFLSDFRFDLYNFKTDINGNILKFDASCSAENLNIFDFVLIKNSYVSVNLKDANDLNFNITGDVFLTSTNIPDSLKNFSFTVNEFLVSSKEGIKSFNIGVKSDTKFELYPGIVFSLSSLNIFKTHFSSSAIINLDFPGITKINDLCLEKFSMDWNGNLLEFETITNQISCDLWGFNSIVSNFNLYTIDSKKLCFFIESVVLSLPTNGSDSSYNSLEVKNIEYVDKKLSYEIVTKLIEINIADFILALRSPYFDIENKEVKFEEVSLELPELISDTKISLNNISISSSRGLEISGFRFELPSFSIGKNINFRGIIASFSMEEGKYYIDGSGGLCIPNIGNIDARVSFTNPKQNNPFGFKSAYFSFEAAKGSLKLGTTGLCLSGIRGGFAYGDKSDLPELVQNVFSEGFRIQLGLTLQDINGGALVKMKPDVWIDVINPTFAFLGDITVWEGSLDLRGKAVATLSKYGFYAGMGISLNFVKGELEMYIFEKNNKCKFSGSGKVQFCIPKGSLINKGKFCIPKKETWLSEIEAEFGNFANDCIGFKASVNLPIFGKQGFFLDKKGINFTNISSYTLLKPENAVTNSLSDFDDDKNQSLIEKNQSVINPKEKIFNINLLNKSINDENVFFVNSELEKIIFAISSTCEKFDFTLTDDFDNTFSFLNDDFEVLFTDDYVLLSLSNVHKGRWKYNIFGSDSKTCSVELIEIKKDIITKINDVSLDNDNQLIKINYSSLLGDEKLEFSLYQIESQKSYVLFQGLTESTNRNQIIDISSIPDGSYKLYSRTYDSNNYPSERFFYDEILIINRKDLPMKKNDSLRVFLDEENNLVCKWNSKNNARTTGFNLIYQLDNKEEVINDLGNVFEFYLSESFVSKAKICLQEYDIYGNVSKWNEILFDKKIELKKEYPKPHTLKKEFSLNLEKTKIKNLSIPYYVLDKSNINEFNLYSKIELICDENGNVCEDLTCTIINNEDGNDYFLDLSFYANKNCPENIYFVHFWIANEKDLANKIEFNVQVNVKPAMIKIENFYPEQINRGEDCVIDLFGEGFSEKCSFYCNGIELSVLDNLNSYFQKKILLPSSLINSSVEIYAKSDDENFDKICIPVIQFKDRFIPFSSEIKIKQNKAKSFFVKYLKESNYIDLSKINIKNNLYGINLTVKENVYQNEILEFELLLDDYINIDSFKLDFIYEDEYIFSLNVFIQNEDEILINKISSEVVYKNETFYLYGENFSNDMKLYLNGEIILFDYISSQIISVFVSEEMKSGELYIINGDLISNSLNLIVKNNGFRMYLSDSKLKMKTENSVKTLLSIYGEEKDVFINITSEHSNFFSFETNFYMSPNEIKEIEISCNKNVRSGIYVFRVNACSENYFNYLEFEVHIKNKLIIETNVLNKAFIGVPYCERISFKGEEGKTYLSGGVLPDGLKLLSDGKIEGIPEKKGLYAFELTFVDKYNTYVTKNFSILVSRNSKYSESNSYVLQTEDISSKLLFEEKFNFIKEIKNVLSFNDLIIFIFDKSISFLDKNLKIIKNIEFKSNIIKSFVTGKYLYLWNEENIITSINMFTKEINRSREEVLELAFSEEILFVINESSIIEINPLTDEIINIYSLCENLIGKKKFIINKHLYYIDYNCLKSAFTDSVIYSNEEEILFIESNSSCFLCFTSKEIICIDFDFKKIYWTEKYSQDYKNFLLVEKSLYYTDENYLYFCDVLKNRKIKFDFKIDNIIILKNKILFLSMNNLYLYNQNFLNDCSNLEKYFLWKHESNFDKNLIFDNLLFLIEKNNVKKIHGECNYYKSETKIIIEGELNNTGWYTKSPILRIESFDKDTNIDSIYFKINDFEWHKYTEPVILPDFVKSIKAYSLDENGLVGLLDTKLIQIDSVCPESCVLLDNDSEWISKELKLRFIATDNNSGVDNIFVNGKLHDGYINLSSEGIFNFEFFAVDKAGNIETTHYKTFRLDFYKPEIYYKYSLKNNIILLDLFAKDSFSGIEFIEYSFNGKDFFIYKNTLSLDSKKYSKIYFRARDYSKKYSDVKKLNLKKLK